MIYVVIKETEITHDEYQFRCFHSSNKHRESNMASSYDTLPSPSGPGTKERSFKSKCGRLILDNANIFKAFVGTNFLGASFALSMSGLYLGIAGLVLIASMTVHCCYLIVKCKRYVIEDLIKKFNLRPESSLSHRKLVENIEQSLSYGDVARLSLGKWGIWVANFSLVLTQLGFCINYFIFIGNTIQRMFPFVNATTVPHPDTDVVGINLTTTQFPLTDLTTQYSNWSSVADVALHSTAPRYELLVLIPFPLFVGFAFLRKIRHLGSSSIIANGSVFIAFGVVMYYILQDFRVNPNVVNVNWTKFPVFFGQITNAYEGIGTIIPIESSMEGNRHLYPLLLHINVIFFTLLMASIGIMGYLFYGPEVQQIITWSLPTGEPLTMMVNVTLIVAISFTFPLQVFPIVEILEQIVFGPGRCLGPPLEDQDSTDYGGKNIQDKNSNSGQGVGIKDSIVDPGVSDQNGFITSGDETKPLIDSAEDEGDEEEFMRDTFKKCVVTVTISDSVATWKRNVLRVLIVVFQLLIALALKNNIAYFGAFVGAIGSTILGYILPCSIHLVLRGKELHPAIWIKNISLIVMGIAGGISGVYVSIVSIVNNSSV